MPERLPGTLPGYRETRFEVADHRCDISAIPCTPPSQSEGLAQAVWTRPRIPLPMVLCPDIDLSKASGLHQVPNCSWVSRLRKATSEPNSHHPNGCSCRRFPAQVGCIIDSGGFRGSSIFADTI